MIITICSKFGTRGLGVAVSVGEGVEVDATVAGTGVRVCVARGGVGDISMGAAEQAANKIITTRRKPIRFVKFIKYASFGIL
jgi:hypothetical protein